MSVMIGSTHSMKAELNFNRMNTTAKAEVAIGGHNYTVNLGAEGGRTLSITLTGSFEKDGEGLVSSKVHAKWNTVLGVFAQVNVTGIGTTEAKFKINYEQPSSPKLLLGFKHGDQAIVMAKGTLVYGRNNGMVTADVKYKVQGFDGRGKLQVKTSWSFGPKIEVTYLPESGPDVAIDVSHECLENNTQVTAALVTLDGDRYLQYDRQVNVSYGYLFQIAGLTEEATLFLKTGSFLHQLYCPYKCANEWKHRLSIEFGHFFFHAVCPSEHPRWDYYL